MVFVRLSSDNLQQKKNINPAIIEGITIAVVGVAVPWQKIVSLGRESLGLHRTLCIWNSSACCVQPQNV